MQRHPSVYAFYIWRRRLRLTQARIASRAGCSTQTVSVVERGYLPKRPTRALVAIARALREFEQELQG